jgi:hypothetical protein
MEYVMQNKVDLTEQSLEAAIKKLKDITASEFNVTIDQRVVDTDKVLKRVCEKNRLKRQKGIRNGLSNT